MHQYYPSLLLRHGLLLQTITGVVLFTFTWLLVYPTLLAAQTPGSKPSQVQPLSPGEDAEFAEALAKIEEKLATLRDKLARVENTSPEEADLKQWRKRLMHLDARARKTFDRMEQHLHAKGVPEEILSRHQAMVTTYKAELATLLRNLDALAATSSAATRQDKATQTLQQLQTKQQRSKSRRFDPNHLPFRVPDGKVRKPKETKEEFRSTLFAPQSVMVAAAEIPPGLLVSAPAVALSAPPTPDDLTPTEDVQITDEIRALAASLDHNPVQIYNWVHDNLEFLPTYGSIQGSHMALQTKRGNAFDTASLLIALLRAADIPARYVYGTVQIPMAKVMNWVGGVTHPEAALQVLGQGGIPSIGLVQGGVLTAVKLEHVWVEAWVDFEPSRGAVHREGDMWVPLDASFKPYQYTNGLAPQAYVPFDAPAFIAQATATAQMHATEGWVAGLDHTLVHRTLSTYQDQVAAYITAHTPGATVGEVLGTKTILPARRPVLAAGLPYALLVRGQAWTQIPDHLRHKFQFTLYTSTLTQILDEPVLRLTQSLPQLASKKLTLSFVPASQADIDLIASYLPQPHADGSPILLSELPTTLPGYMIRLVAELRMDGQIIARGGFFTMGQVLVSTASLYNPERGWQEVENTPPVAGEYRALALNAAGISISQVEALQARLTATKAALDARNLTGLTADDVTGDLLYSTVLSYFLVNDVAAQLSAQAMGMIEYRLPSFGSFTAKVQPQFLFGISRTVTFSGLELDITRQESLVVSQANNRAAQVAYVQQSGLRQSAYEHLVPERLFRDAQHPREAVSAVKALAMASRQGQRLYAITPTTVTSALPHLTVASDVVAEIEGAVATGKLALVSQHEVTAGRWTGVGYIIFDPETGASAYQISGGANGAFAFARGAEAGTLLIVGLLAVAATFVATGPFIIPAISLLSGELAAVATGIKLLYDQVPTEDRPCFWAGLFVVLTFAGFPGLLPEGRVALIFWLVDFGLAFPISADPPTKCLWGVTLPI